MKNFGLRFYILFNIIVISGVGVILLGVISLKITEQFAIKGKVEGTRAIIEAFGANYDSFSNREEGLEFLKNALEPGAWGVVVDNSGRHVFATDGSTVDESKINEPALNMTRNTGEGQISVFGSSLIPFSSYEGFSLTVPVRTGNQTASVFVFQSLDSFADTISTSRKLISVWILLFILILAIFGYYLLSTTIVKPVHKLTEVTHGIASGNFNDQVNVGNIYEMNQLYNALSSMYSEIESNRNELKTSIQDLETANRKILNTQKELIASEKMASLGRLSAGVAHEIGNPLSAISGYIEVLKRQDLLTPDQTIGYLKKISGEIDRINTIIKTLLDYSRPKESKIELNDLNDIISESVRILTNQGMMKDINIDLQTDDKPIHVKVDRNQMIQVFINLILNSRDAVNSNGNITISSRIHNNQAAEILISDNGYGIPDNIADHIFDPFFTTKEPGAGTGLGLSVSQRIVEQFNGKLSLVNSSHQGTTFSIIFDEYQRGSDAENTTG